MTLEEELQSLVTVLQQERKPYEEVWDEIASLFYEKRRFYAPKDHSSSRRPTPRYSSRAKRAWLLASKGFQGYTADRRADWLQLAFEDQTLMGEYMVQDWLEACQRILVAHFSRSGLYEALAEMIPDAMNLGTGSLYSEEDIKNNRISYKCKHPKAVYVHLDSYGMPSIIADENWASYTDMIGRFGEDKVHESWVHAYEQRPLDSVTVWHIVKPMDKRYLSYANGPKIASLPYISIWFDLENLHIIDVGTYWELPYVVWNYDIGDGEYYGTGPGWDALDDTYMANQVGKSKVRVVQITSDPPLLVDDALEGSDHVIPGYHIYRKRADQGINPVELGANYPTTLNFSEEINESIDALYNVPIYQMLQMMDAKNKTATEVVELAGERVAVLGPVVGRYELSVLQPIVRRSFNLLKRAGMLPEPPQAVMDAFKDNEYLKIQLVGRLSQIQRRYYRTDGINQVFGYLPVIAQLNPQALDNVDFDQLTRETLEDAGAPASIVRETDDVGKLRQERAQQQQALLQQQQQAEAQQALVANADKLGKKPETGSPLSQMSGGASNG